MWYIFKGSNCLASCDFEPNIEDLKTRGESAIEHADYIPIDEIEIIDNKIFKRLPTTEEKLEAIRAKRNNLLAESDWTDTLSAKNRLGDILYNAWQTYRQALRDMPETCDVDNPVWPIKPQ